MADDRILINETNRRFWDSTGYKRGQRLDMSNPTDRQMAQTWLAIYQQLQQFRSRVISLAREQRTSPYVLALGLADNRIISKSYPDRGSLDADFSYALGQAVHGNFNYVAAFDFAKSPNAPVFDHFVPIASQQPANVSGWH